VQGFPFLWSDDVPARVGVMPLGGPASAMRWVEIEPAYVFQQARTNVLLADSNVLPAVAWNRVQFNTLGTIDRGGTRTVASRFVVWGAFDFAELSDRRGQLLDVTSFGSPAGTPPAQLGAGLAFANLVVGMTFPETTPTAKTFAVDTANMAWDQRASSARAQSLFRGFGLSLKSFVNASGGQTAAELGFLPVTSELDLTDAPTEQVPEGESTLVELFAKTVSGDVRIERAPARKTGVELSERP